jgi:nucleoporin NUP159
MSTSAHLLNPKTRANIQWLQLVKTNHDVNVRVSERINLEGLPLECNLMAVSNKFGVLIVGSNSGQSNP